MHTFFNTHLRFALAVASAVVCAGAAQASVTISTNATQNMSCSAGVCSPTAKKAVLNVNDLTTMLASDDVKITTGAGAVTITVVAPFSWTSAHRLTLDANYNVSFRAPVTVAGTGAVTITYNDGGSGGDLIFFPGAKLDFWDTSSSLVINGKTLSLVRDLPTLIQSITAMASGSYALAGDYDAAPDGHYNRSPIDTFAGIFEGLGHTISNLTIKYGRGGKRVPYVALFAQSSGVLRDIHLENTNVSSTRSVGGLVGENKGLVLRSTVSGKLNGAHYLVGGLVANNVGSIQWCYSSADVKGGEDDYSSTYDYAGGLVGSNTDGSISDSSSVATVTMIASPFHYGDHAGGLAGSNWEGALIVRSHSAGIIRINGFGEYDTTSSAGGLVGRNAGQISSSSSEASSMDASGGAGGLVGVNWQAGKVAESYALGSASGATAGGLVGINVADALVQDSYAFGTVQGIGGLAGRNDGTVSRSYSISSVNSDNPKGGLVGTEEPQYGAVLDDSYWDLDTSGIGDPSQGCGNIQNCPGATGLTDAQLTSALPDGFDPAVWGQSPSINNGYPYLLANPPPQ